MFCFLAMLWSYFAFSFLWTALPTFSSCGRLSRPLEVRSPRTTSGTVSPVQLMLNDAARVSQALAPVLHREGLLVGPLPTDEVLHGKPDRAIRFVPCYLSALGSCRQVQTDLHSHDSLLLQGPVP